MVKYAGDVAKRLEKEIVAEKERSQKSVPKASRNFEFI